MITNLPQLTSVKGTELTPLVEALAKRADLNRDGRVSKAEFEEFLETAVKAADVQTSAAGTAPKSIGPEE